MIWQIIFYVLFMIAGGIVCYFAYTGYYRSKKNTELLKYYFKQK